MSAEVINRATTEITALIKPFYQILTDAARSSSLRHKKQPTPMVTGEDWSLVLKSAFELIGSAADYIRKGP